MAITEVTPPDSSGYTTLAKVKALLSIDSSDTDFDSVLTDMIDEAASVIEIITGRKFASRRVIETVPGYGGTELLISTRPIVTLHEIQFRDVVMDSTLYEILDHEAGIIHAPDGFYSTHSVEQSMTSQPLAGTQSPYYAVDMTGGFDMATADTPNYPLILRRAAHDFIANTFSTRDIGSRLTHKRVADASWSFNESQMTEHLESLLAPMKATV